VSYLLLYGTGGWSQRWQIPPGTDALIHEEISRIGQDAVSRLSVIDSQTDSVATLVIAWHSVAAAVVVDAKEQSPGGGTPGQYA
jgi:hypothetical protein